VKEPSGADVPVVADKELVRVVPEVVVQVPNVLWVVLKVMAAMQNHRDLHKPLICNTHK
jgi:hypothetical protein